MGLPEPVRELRPHFVFKILEKVTDHLWEMGGGAVMAAVLWLVSKLRANADYVSIVCVFLTGCCLMYLSIRVHRKTNREVPELEGKFPEPSTTSSPVVLALESQGGLFHYPEQSFVHKRRIEGALYGSAGRKPNLIEGDKLLSLGREIHVDHFKLCDGHDPDDRTGEKFLTVTFSETLKQDDLLVLPMEWLLGIDNIPEELIAIKAARDDLAQQLEVCETAYVKLSEERDSLQSKLTEPALAPKINQVNVWEIQGGPVPEWNRSGLGVFGPQTNNKIQIRCHLSISNQGRVDTKIMSWGIRVFDNPTDHGTFGIPGSIDTSLSEPIRYGFPVSGFADFFLERTDSQAVAKSKFVISLVDGVGTTYQTDAGIIYRVMPQPSAQREGQDN